MPIEVSATLLAAFTIFIGGASLNLPTWGIFLGWAAISLPGGPSHSSLSALGRTLPVGAVFALGTLWLQGFLASTAGPSIPAWAPGLAAILVMNPGMLLLGRIRALSLVPGMFVGFSTVLATHLGHFGPVPGSIVAAFLCGLGMNLLGLGFACAAKAMSPAQPPGQSRQGTSLTTASLATPGNCWGADTDASPTTPNTL
ncbi:DUF1097 domain-containing protein [Arthrobacter sp. 35W]|uniref:DUF1097 domain-containing protein n=1 Tax=Arthrobacter sp. 35W TaxID=1132441 RepID=UPI0018CBC820|nr:DUF1097 domain-containing protein [Arthrobacter sp. 35W]